VIRVRVSRDRCIGAGNCVGIAPRVFRLDVDRKAEVVDPAGASEAEILDAVEACPTAAILLLEGRDDRGDR
jgi:ferredoxin